MPRQARAGRRGLKTEEIRKLIGSGVSKATEIQARLAERGIKVSTPMIYTVKARMAARRTGPKIGGPRAAANGSTSPTDIKSLARFIRSVQEVGGIESANSILAEMRE
jgi:hypothetical protein